MKRYDIETAPLIWKFDLITPLSEEDPRDIVVTKIIEQTAKDDTYVCTIVANSPEACKITCQVEDGLKATEFMPTEFSPETSGNKLTWEVDEKLIVSFVMKGNLSKRPQAPVVKIGTKEYKIPESKTLVERKSRVIALPFNHVALFRKASR